jgi:hypothetical protein
MFPFNFLKALSTFARFSGRDSCKAPGKKKVGGAAASPLLHPMSVGIIPTL